MAVMVMTGVSGAVFWLAAALVLFVIESSTVQLVCVWFAFGALVAMFASFFGAPFNLQLLMFFVSSVAVLAVGRPLLKERLMPKKTATNADAVIGQTAIVTEEIDNAMQTGRVSVGGLEWTARSEGGEIIEVRDTVEVKRIEGVKLIVGASASPKGE